jgi:eukaryotic-like serine/threonine-protein kinase
MSLLPTEGAVRDADGTRRVGRFKVLGLVGRGGLGEVYAAHDPELDRRVALKVVAHTEDRAAIARLHREAMTMARLSHPNVARVFDVGDVDGHLFIAMEFVRGVTLRTWLSGQVRTWQEIRDVFLAAGQGLAAAHREGIVHRDFKPDNVVIDDEGRARVIDFGLAASPTDALPANTADEDELVETTQPSDPARGGTPAYMAPELHLGRPADARSDQFSFCVALFEALHGRRPFLGRTWQTLSPQVLRGGLPDVPLARKVPDHLHRAALRGLAATPERRFPDMDTLLGELRRAPSERKGLRYLALGTGLAALVGGGLWLSRPAPELPTPEPPAIDRPPQSPGHAADPARVEALRGQLELARGLRRELRAAEALQVLTALTEAARKTLGAEHELSREAERDRLALARELGAAAPTP